MLIYLVTSEYGDYEGSYTSPIRAYTDYSNAVAFQSELNAARDTYYADRQTSPRIPNVRELKGDSDQKTAALQSWHQKCQEVNTFNTNLINTLVESLGVLTHTEPVETVQGFITSDRKYQSIEITDVPLF